MKHSQLVVSVAREVPKTEVIGVPVTSDKAVPAELGLSRTQLVAAGFDGKIGQTLVVPSSDKTVLIAVGIGAANSAKAHDLRNAAAALARAASNSPTFLALAVLSPLTLRSSASMVEAETRV